MSWNNVIRTGFVAILVFGLIGLLPSILSAQEVVRAPQPDAALPSRWDWAEKTGNDQYRQDYWIGYGFLRLMDENSFIGSWNDDRRGRPTLEELIYNRKSIVPDYHRSEGSGKQVTKEVVVLFHRRRGDIVDLAVGNLNQVVDLDGRPILWLGRAEIPESMDLVTNEFKTAKGDRAKEQLLVAVALHDDAERGIPFLIDVMNGNESDELRGNAAFWLGQHDHSSALNALVRAARNDRSEKVRDQAIFGLSQMNSEPATDALIELARNGDQTHTRKQAIFWLGQKASQKAVSAIKEAIYDNEDQDVQEHAVFALSQLAAHEGVPQLIEISKSHPNPHIRKTAIFWLGQSGDERALDVLIELAKGNQ